MRNNAKIARAACKVDYNTSFSTKSTPNFQTFFSSSLAQPLPAPPSPYRLLWALLPHSPVASQKQNHDSAQSPTSLTPSPLLRAEATAKQPSHLTSAKSTLTSPGLMMISEIPTTPCRRMSSATRKASWTGVASGTIYKAVGRVGGTGVCTWSSGRRVAWDQGKPRRVQPRRRIPRPRLARGDKSELGRAEWKR